MPIMRYRAASLLPGYSDLSRACRLWAAGNGAGGDDALPLPAVGLTGCLVGIHYHDINAIEFNPVIQDAAQITAKGPVPFWALQA
jgi:hypothetical protein